MTKKIKPWNLFVAETMNALVDLESKLRALELEVADAATLLSQREKYEAWRLQMEHITNMATSLDALQVKLGDTIKALFQLDMNERKCEAFVAFQIANGAWESDLQ